MINDFWFSSGAAGGGGGGDPGDPIPQSLRFRSGSGKKFFRNGQANPAQ